MSLFSKKEVYYTTSLSRKVSWECRLPCCLHHTTNVLMVAMGTKQNVIISESTAFQTTPRKDTPSSRLLFLFVSTKLRISYSLNIGLPTKLANNWLINKILIENDFFSVDMKVWLDLIYP